jgi:P-type E1-E2 ATPase
MIHIDIPGRGPLELQNLVLDLNGTLSLDGVMLDGVKDRVDVLRNRLDIQILTADTQGTGAGIAAALGVKLHTIEPVGQPEEKLAFVKKLGAVDVMAIGNGANDALMLEAAALGVCIVGPEGCASETIAAADVVVRDINAALDLLLKPKRLIATLRR